MDLSKAFDRAPWPALCPALFEQGVPQHLICFFLQRVYCGQHGEIVGDVGQSDQFPITGGVRQGPRSQSAVILSCFGHYHAQMEACRWTGRHR